MNQPTFTMSNKKCREKRLTELVKEKEERQERGRG